MTGMLWFSYRTSLRYAFAFEDGYPLYPMIVLGACFSAYVRLRPRGAPRPVVYTSRDIDPLILSALALLSCAFLLEYRGEEAFTLTWFVHLSVLTYFAMLIPYIAGYASGGKAKPVMATLTALVLAAMFWYGTELQKNREPGPPQNVNVAPPARQGGQNGWSSTVPNSARAWASACSGVSRKAS